MRADFPPDIGPLSADEIRVLDAVLPSIALGDDTPLHNVLESILRRACSADDWQYYESLPRGDQLAALDRVRAQIPLIGP